KDCHSGGILAGSGGGGIAPIKKFFTVPKRKNSTPSDATTINAIAGPFTLWSAASREPLAAAGDMKAGAAGPGAATPGCRASANSGKEGSGCKLPRGSSRTCVWAFTRPSRIHCRIWSAVMGPYSFWSAPMILYIGPFSLITSCELRSDLGFVYHHESPDAEGKSEKATTANSKRQHGHYACGQ